MSSIYWTGIQELYSGYNNMLQSRSLKIEALSFLFCHLLMLSLFLNLFSFKKIYKIGIQKFYLSNIVEITMSHSFLSS